MINFSKIEIKIFLLLKKLFPINRSITGSGTRYTLKELKKINSKLKIFHVPSKKKVFDWEVPLEWNVKDAWIKNSKKKKILDFKKNNLSIVNYSTPVKKKINLAKLKKKIFFIKNNPKAIPYVTSYYQNNWGFCMPFNQFKKLKNEIYEVFIDSSIKKGRLSYGEIVIPGKLKKEILLSTYVCHPSMANNELSGPCLLIYFSKWLSSIKRKYTYRIIFIPETIGSLVYLNKNFRKLKKRLIGGYVVTCVGDDNNYSYLESRQKNSLSDRIARRVLNTNVKNFNIYTWLDRGSDERNFCAPGFDLPIGSLMRSKYGEYKEYHTSLDNLSGPVSVSGFKNSFKIYKKIILEIENSLYPFSLIKGEPNLGKRKLYHMINKPDNSYLDSAKILNVISYADGRNSILDIAEKCNLRLNNVKNILNVLLKYKLIKINESPLH